MTCPDPRTFTDLLQEALGPEDEAALARHLEACADCRGRLESLVDAGDVVPESSAGPREPSASVQDVIRKLQTPAPSLSFLQPPQKPGSLGRLGPYDVLEVLGQGGMGIVLKAHEPALDRVVAIKLLRPELAAQEEARRRFLREARTAAGVVHDHIVTIHAVDEFDGVPCLVMAYVVGESLETRVARRGPPSPDEILRIGRETALGLAGAHQNDLVHRDIKPANILLEQDTGRVKIADFGLAKAVDDSSLTVSGTIAGTPHYMAPEQASAQPVDHRADLFALGSVLYYTCTGRPPFAGDSIPAVLRQVCDDTPPPVRKVNPAVPKPLADVIARLMQKKPARRFASAQDVADRLETPHEPAAAAAPAPRRVALAAVLGVLVFVGVIVAFWPERRVGTFLAGGRSFATLEEAVRAGETVEVRADGAVEIDPLTLERPVTIRAADGFAPELTSSDPDRPLLTATADLALEGLAIRWTGAPRAKQDGADAEHCAVVVRGAGLDATGCRIDVGDGNGCVWVDGNCTVRDCRLSGDVGVFWLPQGQPELGLGNTVVSGKVALFTGLDDARSGVAIVLDRVTIAADAALQVAFSAVPPKLSVTTRNCLIDAKAVCMLRPPRKTGRRPATEVRKFLPEVASWSDEATLYTGTKMFAARPRAGRQTPEALVRTLADWRALWGLSQDGARAGTVTYGSDFAVRNTDPPGDFGARRP